MALEIEDLILYGVIAAAVYYLYVQPSAKTPPTTPPGTPGTTPPGAPPSVVTPGTPKVTDAGPAYTALPAYIEPPAQAKADLYALLSGLAVPTADEIKWGLQGYDIMRGGAAFAPVDCSIQPTTPAMSGYRLISQDPGDGTRKLFLALRQAASAG